MIAQCNGSDRGCSFPAKTEDNIKTIVRDARSGSFILWCLSLRALAPGFSLCDRARLLEPRKLRAKVNDFNKSSLVLPGSVTLAFVGLPEIAHQLLG